MWLHHMRWWLRSRQFGKRKFSYLEKWGVEVYLGRGLFWMVAFMVSTIEVYLIKGLFGSANQNTVYGRRSRVGKKVT